MHGGGPLGFPAPRSDGPRTANMPLHSLTHPSNQCTHLTSHHSHPPSQPPTPTPTLHVQVIGRFAGVDEAFYALMVAQLARSCGIKHFYGPTCPQSISYPASAAAACTGATTWPPVRDASPAPAAPAAPPDAAATPATGSVPGSADTAVGADQPTGGQATWVRASAGSAAVPAGGSSESSIVCLASPVAEGATASNDTGPG